MPRSWQPGCISSLSSHPRRTTYRIILSIDGEQRDPDLRQQIHARCISVVGVLARIAKRRGLHKPVKLKKMSRPGNILSIHARIPRQDGMAEVKKLSHVLTHDLGIELASDEILLQDHMGRLQIPWVGDDHAGLEETFLAFLAEIL